MHVRRAQHFSTNECAAGAACCMCLRCRPEGQGVLESMFSPFDAEDIDMCQACKPEV
jgi:hypothetical protein